MFNSFKLTQAPEFPFVAKILGDLGRTGYPAICAGGFPRDVSLGEPYKDIDIFVQVKDENEDRIVEAAVDEAKRSYGKPYPNSLQLILVPCESIVEYIRHHFDFTCCLMYITADGEVYTHLAKMLHLRHKILEFNNPEQDSFDTVSDTEHCIRLLAKGWSASLRVTKALIKTLVPFVGEVVYSEWKANKTLLDEFLAQRFLCEQPQEPPPNRPVVSMRNYDNTTGPPSLGE